MSVYGYARCSTDETRQDINRQVRELMDQGAPKENIYLEYESGTSANRVELKKLLGIIQPGDTLLSTEVSRITRSTAQLCEILDFAKERKIKLVIGAFIVDCTSDLDPMTEGMLKMMGVFAELERNMIAQRVKSGMANAKAKGKRIGRPPLTPETVPNIFYRYYPRLKTGEITMTELAKLCGVTRSMAYRYLDMVDGRDSKLSSTLEVEQITKDPDEKS